MPTSMKATRQEKWSSIWPPITAPNIAPSGIPNE